MKKDNRSFSWFSRLVRPIAWIVFLFPFAVGFGLSAMPDVSLVQVVFGFISFLFVMCFGFTVNAIGDIDIDRFHDGHSKDMNLAHQPLVTGEIPPRHAWLLAGGFIVGSMVAGFLVSQWFIFCIVMLDLLGFIYSVPPVRLKVRPGFDILTNALIGVMCFAAGVALGGDSIPLLVYVGVFLMAANFYIPTVVTDYDFDNRAGQYTSAVAFGPARVISVMYGLTAGVVFVGIYFLVYGGIELQILALIMIVYSLVFTVVSRLKLRDGQWVLHENWILVPFGIISFIVILYGVLKLFGIFIL